MELGLTWLYQEWIMEILSIALDSSACVKKKWNINTFFHYKIQFGSLLESDTTSIYLVGMTTGLPGSFWEAWALFNLH